MQPDLASRMRQVPSVDELLRRPSVAGLAARAGRGLVTQAARAAVAEMREQLLHGAAAGEISPGPGGAAETMPALESRVARKVAAALAPSLRRVINATGVVLHTNLGRAPLGAEAAERIWAAATHYSNLEYDVDQGARGKRDIHTGAALAELAGTEAAIVVNNNAAAVFLALHTLAKGAEVIVSRGELIEIGDGFRIPDIMAESGAILREVGTTNRTRLRDYERALSDRTRLLLRVHPSNFRITGFTERPSAEELVELGRRAGIAVYEDLGSGCLADLSAAGIAEPVVRASAAAGVDILSFSGDKLLGGPQAGILAGRKEYIERVRRNPLFRALRVDKLVIAALEATLGAYRREALDEIPALRMIRAPAEEIAKRARRFTEQVRASIPPSAKIELRAGFSVIGGGSTPDQRLATHLIAISSERHAAAAIEERLRRPESGTPVIARIEDDALILDLRTVLADEQPELAAALARALA
ncbi:MAG TPA: L-seryl-tRNA(Sec) selenium transferase [Candidatus Acidoferrales bacterium]|nr:L-seryl-tRNA(Sec) selenium transferase [Candidatus Acidoferrales bacterium]